MYERRLIDRQSLDMADDGKGEEGAPGCLAYRVRFVSQPDRLLALPGRQGCIRERERERERERGRGRTGNDRYVSLYYSGCTLKMIKRIYVFKIT